MRGTATGLVGVLSEDPDGRGVKDPWRVAYVRRITVVDTFLVGVAVLAAHALRFNGVADSPRIDGQPTFSYSTLAVLLFIGWTISLALLRTRHARLIGAGGGEYLAVFRATWHVFAVLAISAYMLKAEVARGFLAIAFPLGLGLLLTHRYLQRVYLRRRRRQGEFMYRVIAVGNRSKTAELIEELRANPAAGYQVVGVCLTGGVAEASEVSGVPVTGGLNDIPATAERHHAHVVAVTGSDSVTSQIVRRLGWELEGTGVDLVLVPALADIAGPRVVMSPVSGTHLIHVDEPRFAGPRYVLKSAFDRLGALLLTIVLSPVLLGLAILVKVTSRGPVFYRQERIGLNGKPFRMFKFRSMNVGADKQLDQVLADAGMGDVGMFYKLKDDPRVTPVGKVLRRYSLDELPQLFNVLLGDMSLVGPRPQIDREVALYDDLAHRRLRVLPGLTGLWQVSGRSELSPEEAIRMDVYYVENWTPLGDVRILLKTAKAMIVGDGAY